MACVVSKLDEILLHGKQALTAVGRGLSSAEAKQVCQKIRKEMAFGPSASLESSIENLLECQPLFLTDFLPKPTWVRGRPSLWPEGFSHEAHVGWPKGHNVINDQRCNFAGETLLYLTESLSTLFLECNIEGSRRGVGRN